MATNVALTGLARDMQARAETGRPIRIGLIGSGEMGTDIVTRVAHMPGIEIGAISELNLAQCLEGRRHRLPGRRPFARGLECFGAHRGDGSGQDRRHR